MSIKCLIIILVSLFRFCQFFWFCYLIFVMNEYLKVNNNKQSFLKIKRFSSFYYYPNPTADYKN